MMESHDSSFPLRRPFSTTLMPSGAIVMVYVLSPCASSRLIDLSSLVAIGCLAVETIRAKLAREHQRCQWRRVYRYMAGATPGPASPWASPAGTLQDVLLRIHPRSGQPAGAAPSEAALPVEIQQVRKEPGQVRWRPRRSAERWDRSATASASGPCAPKATIDTEPTGQPKR